VSQSFAQPHQGYHPYGGVIIVKNALYGTTLAGGANDMGTVYKVIP
jgi:uncharacterized repeat protein (TIGR03803 family)